MHAYKRKRLPEVYFRDGFFFVRVYSEGTKRLRRKRQNPVWDVAGRSFQKKDKKFDEKIAKYK